MLSEYNQSLLHIVLKNFAGLMQALGAAEKVFELIKREPVIRTDEGCEKPLNMNGHISFQNVSFSYPRRPNQEVLKVTFY